MCGSLCAGSDSHVLHNVNIDPPPPHTPFMLLQRQHSHWGGGFSISHGELITVLRSYVLHCVVYSSQPLVVWCLITTEVITEPCAYRAGQLSMLYSSQIRDNNMRTWCQWQEKNPIGGRHVDLEAETKSTVPSWSHFIPTLVFMLS